MVAMPPSSGLPSACETVLATPSVPPNPLNAALFKFSTNSFAEWNLFGYEYCKTNKRATKQEVKDVFEALSDSEKLKWSALRKEKLAQKKEARNAVAVAQ
ncbi:hypothetical protein BDZ97DRAFT_1801839 [Flammula alnicola]|nr:hypothetical protein BDZ97DRAFT_1801839 [Flammula alnicola]